MIESIQSDAEEAQGAYLRAQRQNIGQTNQNLAPGDMEVAKEMQETRDNKEFLMKTEHMDKRLDFGKLMEGAVLENIKHMVQGKVPIMEQLHSQHIVDQELIKEREKDAQKHEPKIGIAEEERGCLYNRVSSKPELFLDKGSREFVLQGARWESIPRNEGCWVCKAYHILQHHAIA